MRRSRKRVHQQIEKTTAFVINARFGTPSYGKRGELGLPITVPVDKEGTLYARAQAEKKFKDVEHKMRQWNKRTGVDSGIYLREITTKTSRLQGSRYGKSFVSGG